MFECHLTFRKEDRETVKKFVDSGASRGHWKFSEIDGDPVLGQKAFCYLTAHSKDLQWIVGEMDGVTAHFWNKTSVRPLREKIEVIVHDRRYD